MAQIHRIGEPENASETKAILKLAELLPESYHLFHNFEITTGSGLPYEYDIAVIGEYAVYHVEVKGYHGVIRGNQNEWVFENGGVQPSPIPLANKKTKILGGKLKKQAGLRDIWAETLILITDDNAKINLLDDQAPRVIRIKEAFDAMTDPDRLPVRVDSIRRHHEQICRVLFGTRPAKKVQRIGLYDIIEKINQTDDRAVYLASHRYIKTNPKTILKVWSLDVYADHQDKERQLEVIFHDQNALRMISVHPNIIDTGDIFAWEDNKFVLPTEFMDDGRPLEAYLASEEDRKISWKEKAMIIGSVASALKHCHKHGVIHRDIRPLSIVFSRAGGTKLVNFDCALIKSAPKLKDPAEIKEKLDARYVAPEVWKDPAAATPASDVFSLGITFYELITSKRPYADIDEVIKSGSVPLDRALLLLELSTPGSEDFMDSPMDAVAVIAKMCEVDPAQRYKNMDEVLEDLSILGD